MLRKFGVIAGLCLIFSLFFMVLPVNANITQNIDVVLDSEVLEFDVVPMNINGRVMVPMRALFEALGADVEWDKETQTIIAARDGLIVSAAIGDKYMSVNGELREMDAAPVIVDERTLVPVRFVAEAFGAEVSWNEDRPAVFIRNIAAVQDLPPLSPIRGLERIRLYTANEETTAHRTPYRSSTPIQTIYRVGAHVNTNAYTINTDGELWYRVTGVPNVLGDAWIYGGNLSRTNPVPPRVVTPQPGRLTVMYHANGGIGAPTSNTRTIEPDGSVSFRHPFAEPRKEGYIFIGWLFENDRNFEINEPGSRVLVLDLDPYRNEIVTYFAQWRRE